MLGRFSCASTIRQDLPLGLESGSGLRLGASDDLRSSDSSLDWRGRTY